MLQVELHDVYPHAEALLAKGACADRGVCSAGWWGPVCCTSAPRTVAGVPDVCGVFFAWALGYL